MKKQLIEKVIFLKREKKYIVGKDLKFNPIKGDLNIINDHKIIR